MTSSIIRALTVAGFAIVLPMLSAPGSAVAANKYECFTDDGYGRKFPCSARFKRENPTWRSSNQCFTDEGYGRYRPCDSFLKGTQTRN
jgi:hypothetical protein